MDRFEADYDYIHSAPCKHLHSSMDRFEGETPEKLKGYEKNLHSSMDRFEAFKFVVFSFVLVIYIPVWIDLKQNRAILDLIEFKIYIPVWIDLKLAFFEN